MLWIFFRDRLIEHDLLKADRKFGHFKFKKSLMSFFFFSSVFLYLLILKVYYSSSSFSSSSSSPYGLKKIKFDCHCFSLLLISNFFFWKIKLPHSFNLTELNLCHVERRFPENDLRFYLRLVTGKFNSNLTQLSWIFVIGGKTIFQKTILVLISDWNREKQNILEDEALVVLFDDALVVVVVHLLIGDVDDLSLLVGGGDTSSGGRGFPPEEVWFELERNQELTALG